MRKTGILEGSPLTGCALINNTANYSPLGLECVFSNKIAVSPQCRAVCTEVKTTTKHPARETGLLNAVWSQPWYVPMFFSRNRALANSARQTQCRKSRNVLGTRCQQRQVEVSSNTTNRTLGKTVPKEYDIGLKSSASPRLSSVLSFCFYFLYYITATTPRGLYFLVA